MPRQLINYENAIIYKICCKDINIKNIYVGSTTNFRMRKNAHKGNCNREVDKSYNIYVYVFIRENGGWENWDMVEIEKIKCNDANELHSRERYYFELLKADLNTVCPIRTTIENKERHNEYILLNRNKILEQARKYTQKYNEANRDKILKKLETFTCECGSKVSHLHKLRHNLTKKHSTFESKENII